MLIRSQDKMKIVDMSGGTVEVDCFHKILFYGNNNPSDGAIILGEYETEEKAINVLDMIQIAYISCNDVVHDYVRNKEYIVPQESEVE